jgi:hypothetical protein
MTGGYETKDWNARYIAYFVIGLLISAVIIHAGVWILYRWFEGHQPRAEYRPTLVEMPNTPPPEPHLQLSPPTEYQEQRKREEKILNGYGWVDRDKGLVHIPIDEAMKTLAERGVK